MPDTRCRTEFPNRSVGKKVGLFRKTTIIMMRERQTKPKGIKTCTMNMLFLLIGFSRSEARSAKTGKATKKVQE